MKRFWAMLLVLALMISLCACGANTKNDDAPEREDNADSTVSTTVKLDSNVVPMSDLESYTDFREGLIFVTRKSDGRICCINKEGEIQFELSNMQGNYYAPYVWLHSGFYNGLAIVCSYVDDSVSYELHLCKADGTIVKPQDLGCDEFLLTFSALCEELFHDGYILASSGNKMGLLNSNLEWIKPLSEEYYSLIMNYISENTEDELVSFYYGQDMFLSPKGYLNIVTGEAGEIGEIEASLEQPSDFWELSTGDGTVYFRNELYEDWIYPLDLSHLYGDYIKGLDYLEQYEVLPAFGFHDGIADVMVNLDGQHLFSLVNEQGEQILPPTQVKGDNCCYDDITKTYCVYGQDEKGDLVMELFNEGGKISEYVYDVPDYADHASTSVEDGVIMICVRYEKDGQYEYDWEFYDLDYKLLY